MQPTQKAREPSMEEILASIRKIISEDPSGTAPPKPPAPALPPAPGLTAPSRLATPAPPAGAAKPAERSAPSSLEKELADLLREPVDLPPAARAPVPPAERTATPPATPAAAPAPLQMTPSLSPAAKNQEIPSGVTAWFRGKAPANPAFELPQAPATDEAPTAAQAKDLAAKPADTKPTAEPGGSVTAAPAAGSSNAPSANMQAILGRLNSAAAPSATQPAPTPPKARPFPGAEAKPAEAGPQMALPAAPPVVKAEGQAISVEPEPAVVPQTVAEPAQVTPASIGSAPETSTPPAEAKVSALAATAEAIAAAAPAAIAAAAAAASQPTRDTSGLEDCLADLLRPMVRQWLDEHMRGALEKALREEIASKKPKP